MKKLSLLFILGLIFQSFSTLAQSKDTLTLMTYNLMYYRETTSFCTNSNNNAASKDGYMSTIIGHALPDVLVVNELGGGNAALNSFRLLSNALNQNGRTFYSFANATSSGNLANMIYFNSNKLGLHSQNTITNGANGLPLVRLIDHYILYHKEPSLAQHQDTTYLHILAAHLKAGNSTTDENERAQATAAVMTYLDNNNIDSNVFFMGDLNLYSSSEPAYQDLINYTNANYRFRDPVNAPGNWGSTAYASLHTQSTRTSGGCFAGGGMDDRFDFILTSSGVINQNNRVGYLANTYRTLGQDGRRYNNSLIFPTNNSAPSAVINALYNMSDHLPVLLDVEVLGPQTLSIMNQTVLQDLKYENPTDGYMNIKLGGAAEQIKALLIKNLAGSTVRQYEDKLNGNIQLNISDLPRGIYFMNFVLNDGNQLVKKLIKI